MLSDDNYYFSLIRIGDEKAFELIFQRYYKPLFNYAREILKNSQIAEEAIEEVFVKMWENRQNITIENSFKSYLFRSAYYQCLNILKHKGVEDKYKAFFLNHVSLGENNEILSDDFPLSGLLSAELETLITKAINELPEQCRQIFIMSRFRKLKNEEIAQQLDLSINTIKTQIARALKKLRIELKDFLPVFLLL